MEWRDVGSFAAFVGVIIFVVRATVVSFVKQQEQITNAFLESVNASVQSQISQAQASRDIAENLRMLTTKMCDNNDGIGEILRRLSSREAC